METDAPRTGVRRCKLHTTDEEVEQMLTPEERAILEQNEAPDVDKLSTAKWKLIHTFALAGQIKSMDGLLEKGHSIELVDKVDVATNKINEFDPIVSKSIASKAQSIVKKTSELVKEAKVYDPLAAIFHVTAISKNLNVNQLVMARYKATKCHDLHGVLDMAIPATTHLSERYKCFRDISAKGYNFVSYVPLVSIEKMTKAYNQVVAFAKKTDACISSE